MKINLLFNHYKSAGWKRGGYTEKDKLGRKREKGKKKGGELLYNS